MSKPRCCTECAEDFRRVEGDLGKVTVAIMARERSFAQVVEERDDAEQALSQAYYLVTGHSPEWSNNFGHAEALEEISDAVNVLKQAARK